MKAVSKLQVKYRDTLVGHLRMNPTSQLCIFQYDKQWLLNGFSISPLELPLKQDLFIAKAEPFNGNFGIFEDSLPDGYGRYLLNRLLSKQGINEFELTALQRLSIVGNSGMGALSYIPETCVSNHYELPELDELQEQALLVLSEKSAENEESLYFNSGNSGGCRPKCLLKDNEGSWLVKFRHTYDSLNMGQMEYDYNVAARNSGIIVSDFKLFNDKYFGSKRFDIDGEGNRIHIATAGALLNESILMPKLDYKTILHLAGYLTQDSMQVEQMYRRMIFNILTANKDDHAKNFSFMYHNNQWSLAPAYDLTLCANGYDGQHASSVNNNGNPTLQDVLIVGQGIKISKKTCLDIIQQVFEAVSDIIQPNNIMVD